MSSQIENVEQDEYNEYGLRKENWELYRPKKYYTRPDDEYMLKQELKKIENKIGNLKYSEDIPRMSFRHQPPYRGIDMYEDALWYGTVMGLLLGKMFTHFFYGDFYTRRYQWKMQIRMVAIFNAVLTFRIWFMPQNQPQNRGLYEQIPFETRIRNSLDYNHDLYRNIDKLKYTDKYIEKAKVNEFINERRRKKNKARDRLYKEFGVE